MSTEAHAENDVPANLPASEATSGETPAPRKSQLFSIILVILGTFPVGLGVGVVCFQAENRSASKPNEVHEIASTSTAKRDDHDVSADQQAADELFRLGRFDAALCNYKSKGTGDLLRLPDELLYRTALCHEALGQWEEALLEYRALSSRAVSDIAVAALAGQGRVWLRLGEPGRATQVLAELVLRSSELRQPGSTLRGDAEFLLPLAMSFDLTSSAHIEGSVDPQPILRLPNWPLDEALSWASTSSVSGETDEESLNTDAADVQKLEIRVRVSESLPQPQPPPESTRLDVLSQGHSVVDVVEHAALACNLRLEWPTRQPASNHEPHIELVDTPLCVLLSAVCVPLDLIWTIDGETLRVIPASKLEDAQRGPHVHAMAIRTLRSVLAKSPRHRLAGPARLALGQLAFTEGDLSEASAAFGSLIGKKSTPLAVVAAYNLGVTHFHRRDYPRACEALARVVDGAPGHELYTPSLTLLGRLRLDNGDAEEASHHLRRAAGSHCRPDEQARAAVFLAMAYLQLDKPQQAAEALFQHRLQFEEASVRNAAAFLVALARFEILTGERQEREALFLYRSLVALGSDTSWLGHTGAMLIGRAYRELALLDQMVAVYSRELARNPSLRSAAEIRFALAEHRLATNHPAEGRSDLEALYREDAGQWSLRAGVKLAELALADGKSGDCLAICRELQQRDDTDRRHVLKLMGRAFELTGDDQQAALCFAGKWPTP